MIKKTTRQGRHQSLFSRKPWPNGARITIVAMFVLSKAIENIGLIAGMGSVASRLAGKSWLRALPHKPG